MSMTTSYRTEIVVPKPQLASLQGNIRGVPCMEILRLALEKIASERGGTLTEGYTDCRGNLHRCLMGVQTKGFPRGVGVTVDSGGRVQFEFDRTGANTAEADAICRDVARAYAVIAVMRAQNRHNYSVHVEQEDRAAQGKTVQITAVRT